MKLLENATETFFSSFSKIKGKVFLFSATLNTFLLSQQNYVRKKMDKPTQKLQEQLFQTMQQMHKTQTENVLITNIRHAL